MSGYWALKAGFFKEKPGRPPPAFWQDKPRFPLKGNFLLSFFDAIGYNSGDRASRSVVYPRA